MSLSCLVVEDQAPAQRVLEHYIRHLPHLDLVGTCATAFEAIAHLHEKNVDVMFLDINLPQLGGFEFLRTLSRPPNVIVTTAYPEHAVEGFDLDVVDYLLKPIAFDRFIRAVDRVRAQQKANDAPAISSGTSAPVGSADEEIFVRAGGEFRRVALRDLLFLRAEGDYVSIVAVGERHFVAGTLTEWERRLPPERFVRTHRSYIVNLAHSSRIRGSTIVTSEGGIPIGRSYRDKLMSRLT